MGEPVVERGYFESTRTATYGFLAVLPLLVMYEALILYVNEEGLSQIRVGADLWTKQFLASFGATGIFSVGIAVMLIGVAVFVRERRQHIPLKSTYFGFLVGESAMYAVVVAFLVSGVVGFIFSGIATGVQPSMMGVYQDGRLGTGMMLVLSIGAGLYEELIFRVVLVGGLFWILRSMFGSKRVAYIVAALIGAAIFSAVHYIGPMGDVFALHSFVFRFLFGLALNAIFLLRGFGVAAWTHAIYDVLVVTHFFG